MTSAPPEGFTELLPHANKLVQGGKSACMFYRQPGGRITFSPIGGNGSEMYRRMIGGWVPLTDYGRFDCGEYYLERPYEVLFQRGGAKEMPRSQVLELGFPYHPPIVPACGQTEWQKHHHGEECGRKIIPFPQLQGEDFGPAPQCGFCDDGVEYPSPRARDQHIKVMHKDQLAQVSQGQAMADRVTETLVRMGLAPETFAGTVCPLCSETFAEVEAFATHVGLHATAQKPLASVAVSESDDDFVASGAPTETRLAPSAPHTRPTPRPSVRGRAVAPGARRKGK